MAVALLIALWIWDELSFNTYHKAHARLARVMLNQTVEGEVYTKDGKAIPEVEIQIAQNLFFDGSQRIFIDGILPVYN